MNSRAYAAPATASAPAAQVTSIEEGRTEHDQGYFFRIPDWLADRLGQQRASGAAWALVTLVGRKTRWGNHTPQRITLPEMLEHTRYARQTITDALANLVGWGVLYEEREPDRRYVRYALVDLTACSGPYADGQGAARIDLLEHPAYTIPETSLKTRPMATSRYQSKKQTDSRLSSGNHQSKNQTDISLKTDKNRSKKQTDISLKSRPVATDQPAPEAARASSLDTLEKRDTEESTPPDGGAASQIVNEGTSGTAERRERSSLHPRPHAAPFEHQETTEPPGNGVGAAPAVPSSKPSLFSAQPLGSPSAPLSAARVGKHARRRRSSAKPNAGAGTLEAQAALEAHKAALVASWLAHPATVQPEQMSQTERRRFYSGIAKLAQQFAHALEELPALLDAQARWSRGTYTPDPHTMEASLGTLRREAAAWKQSGAASQKGTTHARPNERQHASASGAGPAGLAGTGRANHEGDAAILAAVARVRARQAQAAAASPEACPDPAG